MAHDLMPDVTFHGNPSVRLGLDRVGMSGIEIPIRMEIAGFGSTFVNANVDAYVSLDDPKAKGIHMSRLFLIAQNQLGGQVLDEHRIQAVLREFLESHAQLSQSAHLKVSYELPVFRKALVSDNYGWRYYPVQISATRESQDIRIRQWFQVTYSSTCPCSAALARQLIQQRFVKDFGGQSSISQEEVLTWLGKESSIMATPHGQRSHGRITVVPKANGSLLDFLSMIDMVERAVATPVQGAVKREDEQEFARLNGQNLVFSEDAARKIAEVLDADKSIGDFMVEAVHYESLHAHDAVAVATKGVLGGLASF